jgi:hypothetical protein
VGRTDVPTQQHRGDARAATPTRARSHARRRPGGGRLDLAGGRPGPSSLLLRPGRPARPGQAPRRRRRRRARVGRARAGGRPRHVRRHRPDERQDRDDRDGRRLVGDARAPRLHRRDEGRDGRGGRRRRDNRSGRRAGHSRAACPPRPPANRRRVRLRRPARLSPGAARRTARRHDACARRWRGRAGACGGARAGRAERTGARSHRDRRSAAAASGGGNRRACAGRTRPVGRRRVRCRSELGRDERAYRDRACRDVAACPADDARRISSGDASARIVEARRVACARTCGRRRDCGRHPTSRCHRLASDEDGNARRRFRRPGRRRDRDARRRIAAGACVRTTRRRHRRDYST